MTNRTRPIFFAFIIIVALTAISSACSKPESLPREDSVGRANSNTTLASSSSSAADSLGVNATPTPAPPPPAASPTLDLSPPQTSEVRAALARTYQGALDFDERQTQSVVGDFNGDGASDLAVVARPAQGKLTELNSELANWILEDPTQIMPPDPRNFDPHQGVQKLQPAPPRPRVEQTDALVVVIHGVNETGWRSPQALQTYLLRHAAGVEMRSSKASDVAREGRRGMPRLRGDVIVEKLGGEAGFLYWTGANYGWFH